MEQVVYLAQLVTLEHLVTTVLMVTLARTESMDLMVVQGPLAILVIR